MTKYVVEKVLQVIIDQDDFMMAGGDPSEDLALEIAAEIDNSEWQQVDLAVVGTQ